MKKFVSLLSVAACAALAQAHLYIIYPQIGNRNLTELNTSPCSSFTPSAVRDPITPGSTLSIEIGSTDTHGGGYVYAYIGEGYNPTVYSTSIGSAYLYSTSYTAEIYAAIPANFSGQGTIELYFSAGGNYQCLDIQSSTANTTTTPTPAPGTPGDCCLYDAAGSLHTVCTSDSYCPYVSGWTNIGSWDVDSCSDCSVSNSFAKEVVQKREAMRSEKGTKENGINTGLMADV